ncbi:hypothetical protein [Oceanobacillus manasiensis]|uniref:hypothetical protein n=1 Tax=Oceanobacillus manasiensis TaxID=586413 RepID=UPI0005A5E5F5|nr:hypothetical protein [Oceanobacillus manasiensis]
MRKQFIYLFIATLVFFGISQATILVQHIQETASSEETVSAFKDIQQIEIAHITTGVVSSDVDKVDHPPSLPPFLTKAIPRGKLLTTELLFPDRPRYTWHIHIKKYQSNYLS